MPTPEDEWYAVRCVFRWDGSHGTPFEERITLWRAGSLDAAIGLAEREAREYAAAADVTYLQFAQAYALRERGELRPGAEVFSLLRDSSLPPSEYLDAYFDDGREHRRGSAAG
ncbi:hypothetical protein OHS18_17275 [Amycolatopsis sp. NBC_00355]|uniref:hypothetical protein n=1 Tax=Amycolatopsis sp. NBC_00355 TaxID=2975957 RepID=UPI002E25D768